MIKQQKLEELIREKVPLGVPDSRGFYSFKCPLCNDYKVRAGFKFDNGNVIYNCWNCSTASVYEEFSQKISKKMRKILNAFGVEDSDVSNVVNSSFFNQKEEETAKITLSALTKINTQTPPVALPLKWKKLEQCVGEYEVEQCGKIVDYLTRRAINPFTYPFMFSTHERFKDRVIIPFYRNQQVIYWQARSVIDTENKRYDNAPVSREAVIFNMDQLYRYSPAPLLVCEGVFDALMFNGIALLGSKLSPAKFELLKQSRRRLVFVIDKDKNGRALAETVLNAGYEITFAPDGADDINRAVQRFGRAWTAQQLINNIPMNSTAAQLALGLNCT